MRKQPVEHQAQKLADLLDEIHDATEEVLGGDHELTHKMLLASTRAFVLSIDIGNEMDIE